MEHGVPAVLFVSTDGRFPCCSPRRLGRSVTTSTPTGARATETCADTSVALCADRHPDGLVSAPTATSTGGVGEPDHPARDPLRHLVATSEGDRGPFGGRAQNCPWQSPATRPFPLGFGEQRPSRLFWSCSASGPFAASTSVSEYWRRHSCHVAAITSSVLRSLPYRSCLRGQFIGPAQLARDVLRRVSLASRLDPCRAYLRPSQGNQDSGSDRIYSEKHASHGACWRWCADPRAAADGARSRLQV